MGTLRRQRAEVGFYGLMFAVLGSWATVGFADEPQKPAAPSSVSHGGVPSSQFGALIDPNFIIGVINLRGNVIPVVDVRRRFGFTRARVTELTRIIVIETNDKLVGLMVDNVHQVVRITQSNVDPPGELIEGVSEKYIWGIGRLKDRLIVILNMANILFIEED